MKRLGVLALAAICLLAVPPLVAEARVERIEITERSPFADGAAFGATGAYERIKGRLHYAVDPGDPANAAVADIAHAPRDADGLVRFAGDFLILRPADPARGNRTLLYEVGNRGGVGMLGFFDDADWNNDPASRADAGNGFLLRRGYSLAWSAWNWDVLEGEGRQQIELPVALDADGAPITGLVSAEITVKRREASQPLAWGNSRSYPPAVADDPAARMTVRADQQDERRAIPRARWRFARIENGAEIPDPVHVALDGGFEPGLLYEVVYRATEARLVGLGLAAIRDAISFLRFDATERNPLAGATDRAIVFGISQSGRVINHMLLEGFHVDENGRALFGAALIHVAGAGKGSFNHRFAQTTRHGSPHEDHQYPADFFPFTTTVEDDPPTGARGSLLDRARAMGAVPKLFLTNTSAEYWTRSASLIHTDVSGEHDWPLADEARLYVLSGAQHGSWRIPHRAWFENCINPLDYRPAMRALLVALDAWARDGTAPPASVYPTLDSRTLGTVAAYREQFPAIPGLRLPTVNLRPPRLDLGPRWAGEKIIDVVPPGFGPAYETRVAMPDEDGIDLGGLRLPAVAEPLGTYTGWDLRRPGFGAGDQIDRWVGSFIPFARDEASRDAGDPRRPVATRYPDRATYEAAVRARADALAARRFLLAEEVDAVVADAGAFYDRLARWDGDRTRCEYVAAGE